MAAALNNQMKDQEIVLDSKDKVFMWVIWMIVCNKLDELFNT